MKKHSRNTQGPGAWVLGGVASMLMCVSAFGQYAATQSTPTSIPDSGTATPYPSSIDLTKSNILGVVEKVSVTVNSLTHPYAPDLGLLLVGPNNNAVVLMSNSGGNSGGSSALAGATLVFSDDASAGTPISSPLVSGTSYKPTDNGSDQGGSINFPGPAPSSPYATTLTSAFANINPNGVWSLYVFDTTPGPPTALTPAIGSWTLNLNTTPTIAVVTNSSTLASNIFGGNILTTFVNENGSVNVGLTLNSSSTPVGSLTVTATSIPTLVTNFTYSGTGANRTLTINPNNLTFGTNTLTIAVKDGIASVSTSITLAVLHVNQAPTISISTNTVTTIAGLMTTNVVVATVADPDINFDPNAVKKLNITATSSDSTIVSPSDVFSDVLTAAADKRSVTVIPSGTGTGTATLNINVDDGALTNSQTLTVTVLPVSHPIFANTNTISAPASGSGNSTIVIPANTVSGLIGKVTVLVNGLQGVVPGSTIITLMAPDGTTVPLLNSGPSTPNNYGQLLFADGNSGSFPSAGSSGLTNTIALAPASPLTGVSNLNANGTWTLTVQNNASTAAQVVDGWFLNIFAAPTIGNIANVHGNEFTTNTANFTVGSINGTVTNVTGTVLGNPNLAKITGSLSGNNATLTIVGLQYQYGTNTVQVVAEDNNGFFATNTFTLGLAFVNNPPVVTFIPRQVVPAGGVLGPIAFTVSDPDLPAQTLSAHANSDNQKLLPDSNIIQQSTGGNSYTLTMFPVGTASGSVNVTITANDGTTNTLSTFNVFIQPPANPLFAFANSITINTGAGGTPYAATNNVSGLIGTVQHVSVTLFGITDPTPGNLQLLLVSPSGTNVLLMGGSGGNNALNNTTLVFDDEASGSLPASAQIISGSYQPTANGSTASLPAPAPPITYGADLGVFTNSNPNGNWLLYVADTGSAKGGIIASGWQLSIQTAPNIQTIKDQFTPENTAGKVIITVGDNQPGITLDVTATGSSALFQLPIAVSGSGATRTLTIVPQPYTFGTNVITVTATDPASGNSSTSTFNMGVQFAPQSPLFVSAPGKQTILAATQLGPISFSVWPPQGGSITVTASSPDNPTLVPSVQIASAGSVGGTNNYTLTLIPAGVLTGTATITIVATDNSGTTKASSTNFTLTVNPNLAFANTGAISIPQGPTTPGQLQQGEATPYPSVVNIKGMGGVVSSVQVALVGFSHQFPHDVDVLLVGPDNSTAVMLMAHAALGGTSTGTRLTFADGSDPVPASISGALSSGTYGPSDYSTVSGDAYFPGVILPAPAAPRPYKTAMAAFNGLSPNGNWSLYIIDDTFPTGGSVDNGWVLYLQTAPAVGPIGAQTTLENTPLVIPLPISDSTTDPTNVVITVANSADSIANLATNFILKGTGASQTLTIIPTTNLPSAYNAVHSLTNLAGTNVITVTATDTNNNLVTTTAFGLTVKYVNQTPTVSTATNGVYVDENTFTTIAYTVGDVDSIIDKTNITVTSSDQSILGNSNIVVTGSALAPGTTSTMNVKVTPNQNTHGSLTLTFVATDGNSFATNLVTLNVNHIWQTPTISAIPTPQPVIAGSATTNIAFTVGSVEVSTKSLLVYATSDNANLVPNTPANIVIGGSADKRTIQLFTIGSSSTTANITVFVTDLSGNANSTNSVSFALQSTTVNTQFANTAAITTSGVGTANLYPSVIPVSGLVGATFKVSVILPIFSHSAPANLDLLLVEEGNDNKTNAVMLMSGVGGTNSVNNLRLDFDDSGTALPGTGPLASGTYQPTDNSKGLILPSPAPTNGIWSATLTAAFAGFNPNGNWKLFVNDRGTGDSGNIPAGWQLVIQTAPTIALANGTPSPLVFLENQTAIVTLNIGDQAIDITNLQISASSDNQVLLPNRNVTFSSTPAGHSGSVTATIAPPYLQFGSANVTFIVTRIDGATASVKLPIQVTRVNVPPTISRLDPIAMPENTTSNIVFLVHDDDTPLANLIIQAASGAGNQTLIPSTSLTFVPYGTNTLFGLPNNNTPQTSLVTLALTPNSFQVGSASITITVTDPVAGVGTNIVASTFPLTVNSVIYPPFFIKPPGSQSVAAGGTIPVTFSIASPTTAANQLQVVATSDTQSLVQNGAGGFSYASDSSGTNRTVNVTAQANTPGGTATITVTLTDPTTSPPATASAQFKVAVRPTRIRNYSNATFINILDNQPASPFPSQVTVSNLVGPISKVTATLNGYGHTFPTDVGVLLVGPAGQKIVLMNNLGGGHPGATNINVTFDQSASSSIPANGPLVAGTYLPLDNSSGTRVFQGTAPGGPYTNTLNGFNGTNPNGTWSLYVEDFSPSDVGQIVSGWTLSITTLPVINGLVDVTNQENTAASQNFTVADDTLSTPTFTFSAVSGNQALVTNNGVVFTGSGTNYTVTVNPVSNASGTSKITVTMVNGDGQTINTSFNATFTAVNYPPTIAAIADQTIPAGTGATVTLNYGNLGLSQNQLKVTFGSSNTNLVAVGNMKLDATGTNLLISPTGVQAGSSIITVTVANPNNQTAKASFTLNVVPNSTPVFGQSGTIVINDNAPATPYPSTNIVSGVSGTIAKVTATMVGMGHGYPSDISILLVGPQGQKVVLMSRAGGSATFSNTRVTFDDAAPGLLPQYSLITDGSYQPTDYKTSDTFFSPAPIAPYSHSLSVFTNTDPNGAWTLYVQDDVPLQSGIITGGWILTITTTGPSLTLPVTAVTIPENTSTNIAFTVGSTTINPTNLIVSVTNINDSPAGLVASLKLSGTGTSRTLSITPGANLPSAVTNNNGSSTIMLTVSDGTATNSASFPLTVTYVNQQPTIAGLSDQTTTANVPITVHFVVSDVDNPITNVSVNASVKNSILGSVALSGGAGGNYSLLYTPTGAIGTNQVSVTAADGKSHFAQYFFNVVTTVPQPPVLSPIGTQNTTANNSAKVALTVTDPDTSVTNLNFTGTSTNKALVSGITFTFNGRNEVAVIDLVTNKSGTDFVTISVTDGFSSSSQSFILNVTGTVSGGPATLKLSLSGTQLTLNLVGTANAAYAIQSSTDFTTWSAVTTVTASAAGTASYTAPISGVLKFYRAQSQ